VIVSIRMELTPSHRRKTPVRTNIDRKTQNSMVTGSNVTSIIAGTAVFLFIPYENSLLLP
jgi:hypothetical protein